MHTTFMGYSALSKAPHRCLISVLVVLRLTHLDYTKMTLLRALEWKALSLERNLAGQQIGGCPFRDCHRVGVSLRATYWMEESATLGG